MKFVSLFILIILQLGFYEIKAQKSDWSEPQKVKDKLINAEVIGASNGNYFIVRYNKRSKQQFIIEKYDTKLKLAKKFEFEVPKDISVEKFLLLDSKLYIFSVTYDNVLKKRNLLVNVFSDNFYSITSDTVLISSNFKLSNRKSYHITKDMINNRILIIYPESTKDNNLIFRVAFFDTKLKKLYYNSFLINAETNYQIDQFQLVDSTIAIVYKTFKGSGDDQSNLRYYLIDFDLRLHKQTLYKFFNDSTNFNNLIIKYDIPRQTLICAGYYSLLNSINNEGIAYLKLFKNKDSAIYNTIAFPDEIKYTILGKNNKKEKINSFYPKSMIIRDDGGFLFIGELYLLQKEVYNDNYNFNNNNVRYYYHYGNVMLLSIDSTGKVDWQKVIRKDQVSEADEGYYSSLTTATTQDKVALLYNDISRTRTNLIFNSIEANNFVSNFIIVNGNSFNGTLIPRLAKQVSTDEMIVPGFEDKKGFIFMRIKF
jgi:hypothetical protein